jgi:hypothetical protein
MRALSALVVVSVSCVQAAAGATADVPPNVVNARVETRAADAGLDAALRAAVAAARGPAWIGYAVPTEGRHQMCCWDSGDDAGSGCGGCRLEGKGAFTARGGGNDARGERRGTVALEGGETVVVLFRAEGGQLDRLRTFSADCALDAGGLPFVWLTGVRPAQSVQLLRSLVGSGLSGGKPGQRIEDQALAALAFHAEPTAVPALIALARQDASAHTRGQALFWLSQRAGSKAAGAITRAIEDDPETEVKKRAVFALSQLPRDEGVPLLIDTARRNRNPAVRKQAMFWLGQSKDPRALTFFEEVLRP